MGLAKVWKMSKEPQRKLDEADGEATQVALEWLRRTHPEIDTRGFTFAFHLGLDWQSFRIAHDVSILERLAKQTHELWAGRARWVLKKGVYNPNSGYLSLGPKEVGVLKRQGSVIFEELDPYDQQISRIGAEKMIRNILKEGEE